MEVIGAGLGRTGTSSIQLALEKLGLGPCYHMNQNFAHNHGELWNQVEEAKTIELREAALRKIFDEKGYRSSADYPACSFFEDLLRMNPKAKVLLSVRDKPEDCHKLGKIIMRMFLGKPHDFSQKGLENAYTEWNDHVIAKIPQDQLLVFNVKQGWEPLCRFLNKPIPNEPFPNTNKKSDVDDESVTKEIITLGSVVVFYGGLAFLGYLSYKHDFKGSLTRGLGLLNT
ncbi:Oidioi.mRNA.OKI2018_I69.chr2.g5393.t1.cds [Oikopleura dioica]|uniref:Oidioi.mRNA.OKI2018_I69.chr2.g5393.t1.cds n=1 Tax=Oikopleura dioica TaxID=34765 RepID=A0ABN7T6U3_OIKDI|nr:Oidioi.mRNA.OKI2018_I69.chr2.g5393.t1.cds [Oikopleura dioica]